MIDRLIEKIKKTDNPSVIGLDTDIAYLPEDVLEKIESPKTAADAILDFNIKIIDEIHTLIPAVKVQIAYYEQLGLEGMRAFAQTLAYAKSKDLIVIADAKRGDIGSTASAYSKAFFSGIQIKGRNYRDFDADFLTVNSYLGTDGIKPFVADCEKYDKGIFVLVKTSNASSGELQDLVTADGSTIYEKTGDLVSELGKSNIGKYGYSNVGAVVGATHPAQAERLRERLPNTFFLVPGYGAQGGTADDLKVCFDSKGLGAIVNSSRGILCAYKNQKYKGLDYVAAAKAAVIDMREDLKF